MLRRKSSPSEKVVSKSSPAPKKNMSYDDVADRIKDVGDLNKPLRVALYGRAGSGKTTLAASFPDALLIDFPNEEGTDSVSDVEGLKVFKCETWDDVEQAYWYLESGKHKFKSVIMDTVTQLQELAIRKVLTDAKKNTDDAGGWGSMRKQDWGEVSSLLKTWIMNFRNLPLNCVFLAQDRIFNAGDETEGDEQLAPEVGPRLMPSVGSMMNAAVDLLGHTFIRETVKHVKKGAKIEEVKRMEFCLRVGPHATYMTKMRSPKGVKTVPFLIDPTYDDLLELKSGE